MDDSKEMKIRKLVSLSKEDYEKIRVLAFEMGVTVNACLRICAVAAAERYIKDE